MIVPLTFKPFYFVFREDSSAAPENVLRSRAVEGRVAVV